MSSNNTKKLIQEKGADIEAILPNILEPKELFVIQQRILGEPMRKIGESMQVTRQRIEQMEKKALSKIYTYIKK